MKFKKSFKCLLLTVVMSVTFVLMACSDNPYKMYNEVVRIDDNYRNYYEIFVGAFADSNGDGMGDIKGIINKLDYLNDGDDKKTDDLGITGIWLMPISPSPSYHKYDVTDYKAIDSKYGTIEDFKQLVAECNKRGIKLIVDLVLNHSSFNHAWFSEAVSAFSEGRDSKYIDYYNLSMVSMPGYRKTGNVYYEGNFSDQMPDFNLDSENLRADILDIVKFWLDIGVDGFRLDAIMWAYNNSGENNVFWSWFNTEVKKINPKAYIVGEVWSGDGEIEKYYESQLDSMFAFGVSSPDGMAVSTINRESFTGKGWADYNERIISNILEKNPSGIYAPFLSNHDQGRSYGYLRNDTFKAKFAASLYLTLPGNPFIYYGEEIGMNGFGDKDENKRTAFVWGDQSITCTNPVNADEFEQKAISLKEQQKDYNSMFAHYRHILRLRDENPEIARGKMTALNLGNNNLSAYSLTYNNSTVTIVHNVDKSVAASAATTIDLSKYGKLIGYITCDGTEVTQKNGNVTLPKFATAILK